MIIYLSLLVALIGVLMYALSANPKLVEIGRIAFGCGLLAFLLCVCEHGGRAFGIAPQ
jgi:Na+/phosphate symporter